MSGDDKGTNNDQTRPECAGCCSAITTVTTLELHSATPPDAQHFRLAVQRIVLDSMNGETKNAVAGPSNLRTTYLVSAPSSVSTPTTTGPHATLNASNPPLSFSQLYLPPPGMYLHFKDVRGSLFPASLLSHFFMSVLVFTHIFSR